VCRVPGPLVRRPAPEPGRGEPRYESRTRGMNSLNSQDVSISPLSDPFEHLKCIGPYLWNPEMFRALFSNTEMFRALWGPHAKSETTFVYQNSKLLYECALGFALRRLLGCVLKTRCKTSAAPGRPTHVCGHPGLQTNNLHERLKTILPFSKGFPEHGGPQSSDANNFSVNFGPWSHLFSLLGTKPPLGPYSAPMPRVRGGLQSVSDTRHRYKLDETGWDVTPGRRQVCGGHPVGGCTV
jgi:hypothetical protein